MKAFFIKSVIFILLCIGIDRGTGFILKYLYDHAKSGYTGRENYITHEVDSDILIFGSSRAVHHYVPSILSDSLQMSCYNCGLDGKGIIYNYGRLKTITDRVRPEIIILEFTSDMDLEKNDFSKKDITSLRPYYNNPGFDSIFKDVDPLEKWKMISHCYPFNSKILQIAKDNISTSVLSKDNGYLPQYGKLSYEPEEKKKKIEKPEIDMLKYNYLVKFIQQAKAHSTLIIFISPVYGKAAPGLYPVLKQIGQEFDIPIYNHQSDYRITQNRNLFADPGHLNDEGAVLYSKLIINEIKSNLD